MSDKFMEGLVSSAPAAAAVLAVVIIFVWYLNQLTASWSKDERSREEAMKSIVDHYNSVQREMAERADNAFGVMTKALDRNSEALGRNSEALARVDRKLEG